LSQLKDTSEELTSQLTLPLVEKVLELLLDLAADSQIRSRGCIPGHATAISSVLPMIPHENSLDINRLDHILVLDQIIKSGIKQLVKLFSGEFRLLVSLITE
jgi:hypothetical protein